eukprot:CAMPEP_0206199658 /NCGR_PEP_ID=MMETSP0166-20121206/10396_1 /ASSEMBLY_ACC=CAM_ASM_000260 /TAXON_ID=95228 /ORGANISM="Vannella robusta, Strain DIVA3 518/3/11/1/6" /LENGTH=52 /DNA_ID=CAMNT_0053617809 /DNA_START=1258 /DNA_END=1413 /DNA_ORIENTATION=-
MPPEQLYGQPQVNNEQIPVVDQESSSESESSEDIPGEFNVEPAEDIEMQVFS